MKNFISQPWIINNEFTTAPIHNALSFETRAIPIGWLTHLQEQEKSRPWSFNWPLTD